MPEVPKDWPMWDAIMWKCPYCGAATTDIDKHGSTHHVIVAHPEEGA
jgi:hypothetical protein